MIPHCSRQVWISQISTNNQFHTWITVQTAQISVKSCQIWWNLIHFTHFVPCLSLVKTENHCFAKSFLVRFSMKHKQQIRNLCQCGIALGKNCDFKVLLFFSKSPNSEKMSYFWYFFCKTHKYSSGNIALTRFLEKHNKTPKITHFF